VEGVRPEKIKLALRKMGGGPVEVKRKQRRKKKKVKEDRLPINRRTKRKTKYTRSMRTKEGADNWGEGGGNLHYGTRATNWPRGQNEKEGENGRARQNGSTAEEKWAGAGSEGEGKEKGPTCHAPHPGGGADESRVTHKIEKRTAKTKIKTG